MSNLAPLMSSVDMTWRTPRNLLALVRLVSSSGRIGLDPATDADNPCEAVSFFTPLENGLVQSWGGMGLVFCNPPYGRELADWTRKFAEQGRRTDIGVELIALVPARPDTQWWHRDMLTADRICFWKGRLKFGDAKDSAPFPSAVAYWGFRPRRFAEVFGDSGWVVAP